MGRRPVPVLFSPLSRRQAKVKHGLQIRPPRLQKCLSPAGPRGRLACLLAQHGWPPDTGSGSLGEMFCPSEVAGELVSQVEVSDHGSTDAATLAEGQRCL